jgi:hypothetical protein
LEKFKRVLIQDAKTGKKPLFPDTFWGFFKIFGGGKGTPDHENGKLCIEVFFPSFASFGRYPILDTKNSNSIRSVKLQSCQFYIYIEFDWGICFQYKGCCDFTILNHICSRYTSFFDSWKIFFYKWQKMVSKINCSSENITQLSGNGNFKRL